jgi:Putative MetA-pathway of phenol degradation
MRTEGYGVIGKALLAFGALAASGLSVPPVHAAHPLFTEDTGTQGKGNSQLELTYDGFRDRLAGVKVRGGQSAALYSYGFVDPAEFQIGLPYLRLDQDGQGGRRTLTRGINDLSLNVKWRFFERGAFSLAVKPGVTLPTGDADKFLGSGRVDWGALLIASYESGALAFHAHVGYVDFRNTIGAKTSLWQVTGAVTWQVIKRFKLVADVSRETNPVPGYSTPLDYLVVGAIWSPLKNLDLDIGYRYGASKPALDDGLLAGVTVRW